MTFLLVFGDMLVVVVVVEVMNTVGLIKQRLQIHLLSITSSNSLHLQPASLIESRSETQTENLKAGKSRIENIV